MEVLTVPHRYQRDLLVKGLKSFFGDFNDEVLAGILPSLTWVELTGGERLFQFGDVGEELYFVVSGRLRASIPGANGNEHVFGEIARGETIGEMSVITGEPRTATVHAVRTSVLVRLDRVRFETLLRDFPAISLRLTRLIVERLRRAERRHLTAERQNKAMNHPVTIGVIGVRCEQAELLEFVRQLGRELRRWGRTLVLSGAAVREAVGDAMADSPRGSHGAHLELTQWLDEMESTHDFVLLVADPDCSEWTSRCGQQADEILIVAEADGDPAPGPLEQSLFGSVAPAHGANHRLVLLHADRGQVPSATGAWMAGRKLAAHHHVRKAVAADLRRLARIISGNAIGLALSGGGARGFAHIGVYKALCEAGIEVDIVGGTSMGAGVGSFIAMDPSADELIAAFRRLFAARPTGDFQLLPLFSLIAGKRLQRQLELAYRRADGTDLQVEDTWKPFFCVASSYSHAHEVVLRHGPLHKMVRASMSIPGYLPPILHEGDVLIDGGIFNNFPTDVLRECSVGFVVGVDLRVENFGPLAETALPGIFDLLRQRLLGKREARGRYPFLSRMMFDVPTLYSASRQQRSAEFVDLLIRPDVLSVGMVEWKAFDRAIEAGYRAAVLALSSLDASDRARLHPHD